MTRAARTLLLLAWIALLPAATPASGAEQTLFDQAAAVVKKRNQTLKRAWTTAWKNPTQLSFTPLGGRSAQVHEVVVDKRLFIVRRARRDVDDNHPGLGHQLHHGGQLVYAMFGLPELVTATFRTKAPQQIGPFAPREDIAVVEHLGHHYFLGTDQRATRVLHNLPELTRLACAVGDTVVRERDRKRDNIMVHKSGTTLSLIDWDNAFGVGQDRDAQRGVLRSTFFKKNAKFCYSYTSPQPEFRYLPQQLRDAVEAIVLLGETGLAELAAALHLDKHQAKVAYRGAVDVLEHGLDQATEEFLEGKKPRRAR